jgi:molybdopterin converting factor subunit 1
MTVHLFAAAKDLARADAVTLQLEAGATVASLRQRLAEQVPALASLLTRCLIAVNQEFAADGVMLAASDEIAVIPPVSGGSL